MKKRIVRWLKNELRHARARGFVIGLSGGVDSSVAAALAREAAGAGNVLALMLPIHSQKEDLLDARLAARSIGLHAKKIDLSGVYDALMALLPQASAIAAANLKPRLRMLVLYYFANKLNYLVVGTGNRAECSVGYFTKYGDGAVDVLPLAGLLKRQVRSLARGLKVPQRIIDKAPTAGLWPGQTDEGEMGITYAELDDILDRLARGRPQVAPAGRVNKVRKMMRSSAHKRKMPNAFRP